MKLSEIVQYLNVIDGPSMDPDITDSIRHLYGIVDVVANHALQIGETREVMAQDVIDLENCHNKFLATVNHLRDHVKQRIVSQEPAMYAESQRVYEQEMVFETADYISRRKFVSTPEGLVALRSKILNYSDWRLPGMIIRPIGETFVEDMVPMDPLYLVDTMPELLTPVVEKFTLEYQRRLRQYVINDYHQPQPLQALPSNQFGLIFAYNFFNYKPIAVIDRYLREFAHKLRPGGHAVFTYNDCDFSQGVGLAEKNFMCYTPGHAVRKLVYDAGLELMENHRDNYDLAWMDVRKPGETSTLRGAQVLAKILAKSK